MFLPFLPLLIAFITLGVLAHLPVGSAPPILSPWGVILVLWLLSIGVGQLPSRYLGARSILKFSLRRIVVFVLWSGMIYWNRTEPAVPSLFGHFALDEALSFWAFLVSYWLADSLCLDRIKAWQGSALLEKFFQILVHLRLQLPILLLIGLQFGILQTMDWVLFGQPDWQKHLGTFFFSLGSMALAGPFLMVSCWGARPLSSKNAEQIIQAELKANHVSVARVLSWPQEVIATATAGVIGVFPRFRYLLISEQLLQNLTPNELRAVIAHEAGHLKKHHVFFFVLGFIAFNGALVFGWSVLYGFQWFFVWEAVLWPYILLAVLGFALFFRGILGFLSRNFERQADCNSLERTGYLPFKHALLKVAWLNGINPLEDNWHHYGIQQRLRFLADCVVHPRWVELHHQRVFKIKSACVGLAVLFFGFNIFTTFETVQLQFFQFLLPQQIHAFEHDGKTHSRLLQQMTHLATRLQLHNRIEQAEPLYRKILQVAPNDALVLNNLAWLLAKHYEDHPEKIEESIELALLAVQQKDRAFIWDTLAEGHFKLGHNQKAFEAAQHALRLAEKGIGISPEAGLEYYQTRANYFSQFAPTPQ